MSSDIKYDFTNIIYENFNIKKIYIYLLIINKKTTENIATMLNIIIFLANL